jgi:hypothetical protein
MRSGVRSPGGVLALALVLGIGACADTRSARRTPRPAATARPAVVVPSGPVEVLEAACGDTLEAGALRCAEGAAVRRGDTLALMLPDGRIVQRLDNREEGDGFVSFGYAGRLGGSSGTPVFHMLDVEGRDWRAVELINARTGDSLAIADRPLLSPDGARFAVGVMDLETCENVNRIDIWRITGDVPVREYTVEPWDCTRNRGWGASELEWVARDTLTFLRNTIPRTAEQLARAGYDTSRARLVRGSSGWVLRQRSR